MPQIDIITGARRVRRWTDEEKASILAAAFAPGAIVREVARRVGVTSGQIYTWRKNLVNPAPLRSGKKKPDGAEGFSRVVAVDDLSHPRLSPEPELDFIRGQAPALPPPAVMAPHLAPACELPAIEIEAANHKIRIPATMPPALAAAVVKALAGGR